MHLWSVYVYLYYFISVLLYVIIKAHVNTVHKKYIIDINAYTHSMRLYLLFISYLSDIHREEEKFIQYIRTSLPYVYVSILVYQGICSSAYKFTSMLVYKHTSISVFRCINISFYKYASMQVN